MLLRFIRSSSWCVFCLAVYFFLILPVAALLVLSCLLRFEFEFKILGKYIAFINQKPIIHNVLMYIEKSSNNV